MSPTASETNGRHVITLQLAHPEELFRLPETEMFTEFRNYQTGIELALAHLRGRRRAREVELRLQVPADEITDGLDKRIERALGRYCQQRMAYDVNEQRSMRRDGVTSLMIGIPVAALGVCITLFTVHNEDINEGLKAVLDHLGWVFAWIGLWWPLDALLFNPHPYQRERSALAVLGRATVTLEPSVRPAPSEPIAPE